MSKKITEDIQEKFKLLNYIVIFFVVVLLFLMFHFLYYVLDFITKPSIVSMLLIMAFLILETCIFLYLSNKISKQSVKTIENYSNKLDRMFNLTLDIREEKYGDILLMKILEHTSAFVGANAGSIMLLDNDKLVFKTVKGLDSEQLLGVSIPKNKGLAGRVIQKGEYQIVNDVKHDEQFSPIIDGLTGYETRSVLCMPLKLSTGVIGVLELLNKTDGAFTTEDAEFISYFVNQAAIAIDVTNFYEGQKNFEIHLTGILLDAIDNTYPEKRGHSERVAKYSLLMAHAIDMSEDGKKKLYRACLLHDIGFLKIQPKAVLSDSKYKLHPQLAYEMLRPIDLYADIAPIVLHHHELYNGNGYPSGLKGEDIPLESRIIAIAEAFDAIFSKDSYKYIGEMLNDNARPSICDFDCTIEKIKNNAGTQFDPQLVESFVNKITPEYVMS
jgi:HD-GYP domain-containing protein (c-di-GMP phosphodiesterase class II)